MKKAPIKIVTILAIILISIGTILCGIGWIKGERISRTNLAWKGLHFDVSEYFDDIDDDIYSTNREERIDIGSFLHVNMDFDIGDFEIIQDHETYLEVINLPRDIFSYKVENNTLYVSVNAVSWKNNFGFDSTDYKVKLHVDSELGDVKVTSNMGDINLKGFTCGSLDIEQNMGDIETDNVDVKGAVYMDQDMGDVSFSGRIKADSEFENAMGETEVHIFDSEANYTYKLASSLGGINVNGRNVGDSLDSEYSYSGSSSKATITIHNSMGDIELEFDK